MILKSYSKLNLTLNVNFKLRNGLHEIQSLYCWLNLCEKINIKILKKKRIRSILKDLLQN